MAIYKRDIVDINLETGNIHRSFLKHSIGYLDQQADRFGIRTYRDGAPVDLSGVSVQGIFMPPQGSPISITGVQYTAVIGNEAIVVLPQACYNYDGQFTLAIKLVDSTNAITGTMRIIDGVVDNTHASGTVAPTSAVPTYQEILATYDAMVAATAATNASLANYYSDLPSRIPAGTYCIYNHVLYRCIATIASKGEWDSSYWTPVKLGNDVDDLRSDVNDSFAGYYSDLPSSIPVGTYCIYNNILYRCISPIASKGAWDATKWVEAKLANDTSDLKSAFAHDLNMITEDTANFFDETYFLNAEGWSYEESTDSFTGVLKYLSNYAAADGYPGLSFSAGKRYTITFYAKISGSTTSSYGLVIRFVYSDSTYDHVRVENNTSSFAKFTLTSASGKTVSKLVMTYSSGANNTCWIKDVTIAEGVSENNDPYRMPVDAIARNGVAMNAETIQEVQKNALTIGTPYNTYAPEGFTWQDNPLKGKIRTDFKGTVEVDYDVSVNDPSESGVTYYVDPVNGESTNSGLTPDDAFGKMATALGKSDVSCIMLKGGVYASTLNLANDPIQKTIAIKAMEGENVVIAQAVGSTLTADTDHPGTYYGSRGNCYGVVDMKYQNSEGDPVEYVNASDVSSVYSTPGSWILTNGTFYLHTLDGREQDEDLLCFRSGDNLVAEGNITLYLENLKVYGGSVPLKATAQAGTDQLKVYAKNCDFYFPYTTNDDCVQMQGTTISIFQNCRAKYGKKDGFNYHVAEGIVPKAIEIGCEGAYCGNTEDANDQGSTIHDGGSAIRINCLYHHNQGSNVADETAGTEAWMIGCVAFNSLAVNAGQNANYFTYDGVKFWLESCVGFGSTNNLYLHNSESQIALRNCRLEGKLAPSGQTPIYY